MGMILFGIWTVFVLPAGGLACWRLLAVSAACAGHAAFLAAAGVSLAPLVVVWPIIALEALLGRSPR